MALVTFPTLNLQPFRFGWFLTSLTGAPQESPQGGQTQTQALPGAYWSCQMDYSHARGDDFRALLLWLEMMRGRGNRCRMVHPDHLRPLGAGGGSPVVAGAGQEGASLAISGAAASVAGWLLAFDLVEVDGYLYRVTANADTDPSGNAVLSLNPPLRGSPADAAEIILTRPSAKMMLESDTAGTTYEAGVIRPVVFSMREDLAP